MHMGFSIIYRQIPATWPLGSPMQSPNTHQSWIHLLVIHRRDVLRIILGIDVESGCNTVLGHQGYLRVWMCLDGVQLRIIKPG
jgi:hypothetical protein